MISDKVEEILNTKNITQTELARRLNIRKQSISSQLSYWRSGGVPTLKTIKAWAKALEVPIDILLNSI